MDNETWRGVQLSGFENAYEISTTGRVRLSPYDYFKDGALCRSEGRVLEVEEDTVFMNSGEFMGKSRIKTLFNKTFPNTQYKEYSSVE